MFDSHAHMNDKAFDEDRDAIIAHAIDSGVSGWVEVGTNLEESRKALSLASDREGSGLNIFASVGVHPHELKNMKHGDWEEMEKFIDIYGRGLPSPRQVGGQAYQKGGDEVKRVVCAIGEVGLDFSRVDPLSPIGEREGVRAEQEQCLRRFIALAQEKNLPIIFHVRSGDTIDAHAELIRILKTYPDTDRPKGVIHTFSGNLSQAQEYIDLDMMISFSGVITFKKADELREIAKTIPLESILVETDCPYLTPEPFRGKRNDPSHVLYVIKKIAELRNMLPEEITNITHNNAKKLFNI